MLAATSPASSRAGTTTTTGGAVRELTDGEFVTVLLEGVEPVEVLAVPRAAVLSDQQGDYVFVVGADNKVETRVITVGQEGDGQSVVLTGLTAGENVVAAGQYRLVQGSQVQSLAATSAAPPAIAAPSAPVKAP